MKLIPQYKVISPYNYDRIIRNIEKNYAQRQDIDQTNGKMHMIFKIKNYVIRKVNVSKHLENEASCQLPVLLFLVYTFTLNIYLPMINIVISVKKISDRLYIRVCSFKKN